MPAEDKRLHVVTEAIAVFILAPYLLYVSRFTPGFHRYVVIIIALLTIIIDGYLLSKWQIV